MRLSRIYAAALLLALANNSHAVLTQTRAAPARTQLLANANQTVQITWVINTAPGHVDGALSAGGQLVNAVTGVPLAAIPTTIGVGAGAGPFAFPETINLSAAQLAAWRGQGIRLIGYRRTFVAPASPAQSGQFLIDLRGASLEDAREPAAGALTLQRLDLEFSDGRRLAVVESGATLRARVSIAYSGSGTLRGRWEIADPGSLAQPFYRVLALVREPLGGGQLFTLETAALPTQTTGRYALRFCVDQTVQVPDPCAGDATAVQGSYEVVPGDAAAAIRGISPASGALGAHTPFAWPQVSGTTTYQLQIFEKLPGPDSEPSFVTGMLVPAETTALPLSALVRRKLKAGHAYLWRITAHDADGRLIARSEFASFVVSP